MNGSVAHEKTYIFFLMLACAVLLFVYYLSENQSGTPGELLRLAVFSTLLLSIGGGMLLLQHKREEENSVKKHDQQSVVIKWGKVIFASLAASPISGFDSIGFYYFYYLLKNANKSVSSEEMYQKCNRLKGIYSDDSITEEMESNATIGDYFYFADEGTKDFFAKRRQELLQLQQNSDEHAASILAKELEGLANIIAKEYFTKRGKRKKERTQALKNTANAVGNAIEGAIRELRECGGGKVADHFEKCIDHPRGDSLKYETDNPEINWVL